MTDPGRGDDDRPDSAEAGDLPPQLVALDQQRHLRRILRAFFAVIVLLPIAGIGGAWAIALVPALMIAVFAVREAVQLRRSVRRYGAVRER
ncbi:MAG: hypothetical protein KDC46_15885 [Thermoleophilia bacterium]|nr:hypothetical protein [Thermoleophilia bacterium]